MNLTLKTKAVIMSMIGVLGFGGVGVWYLHSKSATKLSMVQKEVDPKNEALAQSTPKVVNPKSESKAIPQLQSTEPFTTSEKMSSKISESEEFFESRSVLQHAPTSSDRLDDGDQKEGNLTESDIAKQSIMDVLTQRFIGGYERKELDLYGSAFWDDDFYYYSDVGTADPNDDVSFTDFSIDLQSANRIFSAFDSVKIQFSNIELESITSDESMARMKAYYEINSSPPIWFASGIAEFTFKKRDGEWRISQWVDWPFRPDE